jgi:hypothetical protein
MKEFVKTLPKTRNCCKYLCKKFPHLLEAKLKEGIFIGPDIRKLMFKDYFHQDIKEKERRYKGWWNVNMMGYYC